MAKVTEKNTKKEILEALKEAEAKLAELRTVNTTTADIARAKEVEAKKVAAKEVVEMNILNESITGKYNALLETVDMLERQIEELHEVKAGLDTLEAIIIVQNNKKAEFEEARIQQLADLNAEIEAKKAAANEAILELQSKYDRLETSLREDYAQEKKDLERDRRREKEEYAYNLKRARDIENDKWNDEKAAREKELRDREISVAQRESAVEALEATIDNLTAEAKLAEKTFKEAIENALKEGQAKAEKACAIKITGIERDVKWQVQILEKEIVSLKAINDERVAENAELRTKLDEAYTRIQEMALEQAKAGAPRIIETATK